MAPKTLDQIVAQQLGSMNLALIRLQAHVEALTEERDRLAAERDRLLNELATREALGAKDQA